MAGTWIVTSTPQVSALVEAGRRIGGHVTVVALGDGTGFAGVDRVVAVDVPAAVPLESLAPAVAAVVEAGPGDVVLVPNRATERVIAGAIAAQLNAPVFVNAKAVGAGGITVGRHGGITLETVRVTGPAVVVLEGGTEVDGDPVAPEAAPVVGAASARIVGERTASGKVVDLGAAHRVVAVGRGFRAEADLQLARDLAAALGAAVACSRPLAEGVGWLPKEVYVGISGQTVKPDVYVAIGISGQLQHMSGAADSRTIVAVNSDANAPIFAHADYGIVGDLYDVLPALTGALR